MMIQRYPRLTYVVCTIVAFVILLRIPAVNEAFSLYANIGVWGALIAGGFFVSSFTISLGSVLLLSMMETTHPLALSFIAGYGGLLADYVIFRSVRSRLGDELKDLFFQLGGVQVAQCFRHHHLRWTQPILGALIVASPLPDELGIALMGASRLRPYQFIVLAFLLDVAGIYLFISAARLVV